uniref:Golgi associated kinase 1B n=2 Tax=Tetraodon nigroviridis TaxID=99883 RepID=H3D676_TETNG
RRILSKRSLIFASICAFYLFFALFGYSQQYQDKPADTDKHRHSRRLDTDARPDAVDSRTRAQNVLPTRNNVVYITLKSKRLKPANIRGTIRPKLRRKARRTRPPFTQNKFGSVGPNAGQNGRYVAQETFWAETLNVDYKSLNVVHDSHPDSRVSSIRIYSPKAPSWFSPEDVKAMRFLADAKVVRMKKMPQEDFSSLLIFESEEGGNHKTLEEGTLCGGRCGVIGSPVDNTEVFAFHLDRVLGLNRTLPAVSRKFSYLHDGHLCPVVLWDATVHLEENSVLKLTWGEYQNTLKQRCLVPKSAIPKPDSICSTVHHYEWSKLALFDFLLQIHNRLDPSCCGFKPRHADVCVQLGPHAECRNQAHIQLRGIRRGHDPKHLIFTNNRGFFDRNEDNLDFRLLEGIKELPEQAVSVLQSSKLRVRLLQSLFLDQRYWESQGGRQGIDTLIDVIERRAKVLLTYINAHGIRTVTMNE